MPSSMGGDVKNINKVMGDLCLSNPPRRALMRCIIFYFQFLLKICVYESVSNDIVIRDSMINLESKALPLGRLERFEIRLLRSCLQSGCQDSKGKVTTYGAIAKRGIRSAARDCWLGTKWY